MWFEVLCRLLSFTNIWRRLEDVDLFRELSFFFTLALTGFFSLKFEWYHISRTLLSILAAFKSIVVMDGLDFSADLQLPESLFQAFRIGSKGTIYNYYLHHLHVPWLFFYARSSYISVFDLFFRSMVLLSHSQSITLRNVHSIEGLTWVDS